jgi:hypothetical protein
MQSQYRSSKKFQAPYLAKGGPWTFLVERFLLNARFPAACYETTEENKVKQRNRPTANFQATLSPSGSPGSPLSNDVSWIFSSLCVSRLVLGL